VFLEPRERAALDTERAALIAEVERELAQDIASPQEYAAVADLERKLGHFVDRTGPMFDQHCADAHRVWKQACEIRSLFIDIPTRLKARARQLLGAFKEKEERQRRDEERRQALEQQQREQARLNEEAKLVEKQGEKELARAIRATPVHAPTVVLPSNLPEVGLTYREDWTWEPVGGDTGANRMRSLALLVRADYLTLVTFNEAGLTAFARRTKGTIKVPGIRFFSKQVAVRR